jgi:hypothetical protein
MARKHYHPAAHAEGDNSDFTATYTVDEPISPPDPPSPPVPPEAPAVKVLLLGDHVYLPRDPTAPDWAASQDTVRVEGMTDGRRTRVECHPTLAAFLQGRNQAETLD